LFHDNARPHTAAHTVATLRALKFEVLKHPPYSPDLAPSDFHLFGHLKEHMLGQNFADDNEVMEAVQSWLKATPKNFLFYLFIYLFTFASASLWTGGPSVLRSRGTMSKNKT
jgi:transposase